VRECFAVIKGVPENELLPLISAVQSANAQSGGRIISSADPSNNSATGVFTRAFLLLRLATGLKRRNWALMRKQAPGGNAPWQLSLCKFYSEQTGLWDSATTPPALDQLGEDFAAACQDLDTSLSGTPFNGFQLWRKQTLAMIELTRLERLGVLASCA